jgi:hypothetical protein
MTIAQFYPSALWLNNILLVSGQCCGKEKSNKIVYEII